MEWVHDADGATVMTLWNGCTAMMERVHVDEGAGAHVLRSTDLR